MRRHANDCPVFWKDDKPCNCAMAELVKAEARLAEANARADIWEKNYAAADTWPGIGELEMLAARWLEKAREENSQALLSQTDQDRLTYSGLAVGREECAKALLDYLATRNAATAAA